MNFLGIDLGTTNSVACTIKKGKFDYIRFRNKDLLPSCILYKDGKITVGEMAKSKAKVYSDNYMSSSKTYIGQPVTDKELYKEWTIEDRLFTPTDVACEVLKAIKKEADSYFGNNDDIKVVVTIPAYFQTVQREETKKAAENAGFIVKQIISEPVAAAVAYGFENEEDVKKVYVVDIGGGTFDVTLLDVDNRKNIYQVLMKAGNQRLGGDDFDKVILDMFLSEIRQRIGVDLSTEEKSGLTKAVYSQTIQRLLQEAELTKVNLSEVNVQRVEIPNLFLHKDTPYNLDVEITREKFIKNSTRIINEIKKTIRDSIDDNGYKVEDIDRIILVGGTSKLPVIYDYVEEFFEKKPFSDKDLSKLVAMGAALIADDETSGIVVKDIIAHSLGIEVVNGEYSIILPKNEPFPLSKKRIYTTAYDNQEEVDICVYEGEEESNINENTYIGEFTLENIKKAKKGVPKIEVEFSYDKSMILKVTAKDLDTAAERSKVLTIAKGVKKEKVKHIAYDFAVMLDNSGSMAGGFFGLFVSGTSPMEDAKKACKKLASDIIDLNHHKMGLITFETYSVIKVELTDDKTKILKAIDPITTGGSTNMVAALEDAKKVLAKGKNTPIGILITDGAPDNDSATQTTATALKKNGIRLITIGVGTGVKSSYLQQIASKKEDYYYVDRMDQLAGAFETIINSLVTR